MSTIIIDNIVFFLYHRSMATKSLDPMLSTRQPPALIAALKVHAAKAGKSMTELVRLAVESLLKQKRQRP
jgi:hypothetical protein